MSLEEDEFLELRKVPEQRDYVVIEYPGYVKNIENVLDTLGGLATIEKVTLSNIV
jgi:hypothetical protein